MGNYQSRIEILSELTQDNEDLEFCFGGERRLSKLKKMAWFLAENAKAKLYVLSHGYTQVCGYALELIGIRRHFKGVFGRDSGLMLKMNGDKRRCIIALMRENGIAHGSQALMIDDDLTNLFSCRQLRSCQTLWVTDSKGLSTHDMQSLETIATRTSHLPNFLPGENVREFSHGEVREWINCPLFQYWLVNTAYVDEKFM